MVEHGAQGAMAEQEAMAKWPLWPWPRPSARPQQPSPIAPLKNSLGDISGIGIKAFPGLDSTTLLCGPNSETETFSGLDLGTGALSRLDGGTEASLG